MTEVPQVDPGFGWIGFVVVAILTVFGGGTLVTVIGKSIWDRYFSKKDAGEKIHETNQTAKIEADGLFRDSLIRRIEVLENSLGEMQKEQLSQARTNERLTTENKHLESANNRQAGEITDLKKRNRELNDKVTVLTQTVASLASRLSEVTGQPIDVRLVGDEIKAE